MNAFTKFIPKNVTRFRVLYQDLNIKKKNQFDLQHTLNLISELTIADQGPQTQKKDVTLTIARRGGILSIRHPHELFPLHRTLLLLLMSIGSIFWLCLLLILVFSARLGCFSFNVTRYSVARSTSSIISVILVYMTVQINVVSIFGTKTLPHKSNSVSKIIRKFGKHFKMLPILVDLLYGCRRLWCLSKRSDLNQRNIESRFPSTKR